LGTGGEVVMVCVEDDEAGEFERTLWLGLSSECECSFCFIIGNVWVTAGGCAATGAYIPVGAVVVVTVVNSSPDAVEVVATAAYSGGWTKMFPTRNKGPACELALLWIMGLLLVWRRNFCTRQKNKIS